MKNTCLLLSLSLFISSLSAQETPEIIPLPPTDPPSDSRVEPLETSDPRSEAAPKFNLQDEPLEDRIESALEKAGEYYEDRQRAKCGGALFEAAEVLEELAGTEKEQIAQEAELLRMLALDAARGKLDARKVDLAAAMACNKLARIFNDQAQAAWKSGTPRDAGRAWYRATAFLDRSVQWSGCGLTETGLATIDDGKLLAEKLATGEPVDSDEARQAAGLTGNMIQWMSRTLAEKSAGFFAAEDLPQDEAEASPPEPASTNFLQTGTERLVKKVRTSAARLGGILKRFGEE